MGTGRPGVLALYRHTGRKFTVVRPNGQGRYDIPELELEVAFLNDEMRFWFRGELMLRMVELYQKAQEARRARLTPEQVRAEEEDEHLSRLAFHEEMDELRALLGQQVSEQPNEAPIERPVGTGGPVSLPG